MVDRNALKKSNRCLDYNMPFKSAKQQRYMHYLAEQGKLPKSIDLKEYDKKTDFKHLPEQAPKFKKTRKLMGK